MTTDDQALAISFAAILQRWQRITADQDRIPRQLIAELVEATRKQRANQTASNGDTDGTVQTSASHRTRTRDRHVPGPDNPRRAVQAPRGP